MAFSLFHLIARVRARQRQAGEGTGALTATQGRLLRDVRPSGFGSLYFGAEDAAVRNVSGPPGASPRPGRAQTDV